MAQRWLPNHTEFFNSLGRLILTAERQRQSNGSTEYLVRRLDEYERTLSTLLSRLGETYENMPVVLNSLQNMRILLGRVSALRQEFEERANILHDAHNDDSDNINLRSRLDRGNPSSSRGRPRVHINQAQLEALHNNARFRWNDVARILNVSGRTLRRRRRELGMSVEGREYSDLTDNQLDNVVGEVLQGTPSAGLRLVQGSLNQQGYVVQRARILSSLRRVDPVTSSLRNARNIIRRTYRVPSPNSLWHIDGNHKLIEPYRVVIHGGIDGYSRLVVYLHASTNNKAETVFDLFQSAVNNYNPCNELHLFALQFVYLDIINEALQQFLHQWNNHPVSTECNFSPQQLWIRGMISQMNSPSTAVHDVVNPVNYGVDEDGPVPEQQENYQVMVPQTSIGFTEEQLQNIRRDSQAVVDENGITQYLTVLNTISAFDRVNP